jgi:hypothetical protein
MRSSRVQLIMDKNCRFEYLGSMIIPWLRNSTHSTCYYAMLRYPREVSKYFEKCPCALDMFQDSKGS